MTIHGQLTDQFEIPDYAQDMLFLVTSAGAVRAQGDHGRFTLEQLYEEPLHLAWGAPEGPTLAIWNAVSNGKPLNLGWDGRVTAGGFVERLHAREVGGLDILVAEVFGGAFPADYIGLPSLEDMRRGVFGRPAGSEPAVRSQTYPFIILAESNFAALVQDALVSGLAVDAYGALASDDGHWHEVVGLPLLLDAITLLAP
jgi:hypothetical protein